MIPKLKQLNSGTFQIPDYANTFEDRDVNPIRINEKLILI